MSQPKSRSCRGYRCYLVLLVLPCVWKARNDSGDAGSGCNLARIDHDEQFHYHVVYLTAATLNYEHVLTANGFTDFHTETTKNSNNDNIQTQRVYSSTLCALQIYLLTYLINN